MYRISMEFSNYPKLKPDNWYRIHQWIMKYCSDDPRVLFHVKENEFIVQTVYQSKLDAQICDPRFHTGERRIFELIANPTRKSNGKRYPIIDENIRQSWLEHKFAGACKIEWLLQENWNQISWKHSKNGNGNTTYCHFACRFYGAFNVINENKLFSLISAGVGSAKGFGFGLLLC